MGSSSLTYSLLSDETVYAPGSGLLSKGIQVSTQRGNFVLVSLILEKA